VAGAEQVGGPVRERAVAGDQERVRVPVTCPCPLYRLFFGDTSDYTAGTPVVPPV
jgi:hypothetical protein